MKKCNYCHGSNETCHHCFGSGYEDEKPPQNNFRVKNKIRENTTLTETNFEELSTIGIRDNKLRNKKNINKTLQKPKQTKKTKQIKLPKKIRAIRGVLGKDLFDAYFYSSVSSFSDIATQLNILLKGANLKTKITIGDMETFHGVKSSSKKSNKKIIKKAKKTNYFRKT